MFFFLFSRNKYIHWFMHCFHSLFLHDDGKFDSCLLKENEMRKLTNLLPSSYFLRNYCWINLIQSIGKSSKFPTNHIKSCKSGKQIKKKIWPSKNFINLAQLTLCVDYYIGEWFAVTEMKRINERIERFNLHVQSDDEVSFDLKSEIDLQSCASEEKKVSAIRTTEYFLFNHFFPF